MYYTAICFDRQGKAYKYRDILFSKILEFQSKKFLHDKNIIYINYYDKKTKDFKFRNYLKC
jgi:hypothetical protein